MSHTALDRWLALRAYLSEDLLGGPRPWSMHHVINIQKGGTLVFVLGLMLWYDTWSLGAWAYLALHGSYGLCWLLKEAIFPDPGWRKPVTVAGGLASWALVLGPYWLAPWLLISQDVQVTPAHAAGATILYALGLALMIGADAQKYFVLRARRGLITDGFFARTRNPNYLGEMMIYASFAWLAAHPAPWLVLAWVWGGVFLPNMLRKDRSMSRYEQWPAYTQRSGLLLPRLGRHTAASP